MRPAKPVEDERRDCDDIASLGSEFLEGELEAPAAALVAAHLSSCRRCVQLYAELAWTIAAVHRLGPKLRVTHCCLQGWKERGDRS